MAITNSIPVTQRTPGSSVEFDITSGARGLVALQRRVALIGAKITAGTAVNGTVYQIFVDGDGDTLFGKGSELALMCRAALKAARKAGKSPEIYAVSLAEAAGVKTTKTLTVTGPATQSGNIALRIAGRSISVPVTSGDSATTIATAINTAIGQLAATGVLPGTAGVASAVVTFTYATQGVNGEDLKIAVDAMPTGVGVAVAAGVTGTGAYDITATLDALTDRHYNAIAVANHTSTDVSDLAAYEDARSAPGVKRWSFGFIGTNGTLSAATTLASAANKEYTVVVACEDCPNLPGEIAAHVAVTRFAEEDPSLTMSGVELDLYAPPGASVFTPGNGGEVEAALAAGVTPLSVKPDGSVYIVRLVTTRTTLNGAPYDNLRDFGVAYTLTWVGEQADAVVNVFTSDRRNKKMTAAARKRLRSVLLDMLRRAEKAEILQNVEAHKDEVQVEPDARVPTRMNYDLPVAVVPGLEQVPGTLRLFVENAIAA
jgi:phage tail sheath gpL-like